MHVWELRGGVGNQLFQYFAAKNLDPNPIFDLSRLSPPYLDHANSSIEPIIGEPVCNIREDLGRILWPIRERFFSTGQTLLRSNPFLGRLKVAPTLKSERWASRFISECKKPLRISGYFISLDHLGFEPQGVEAERLPIGFGDSGAEKFTEKGFIALHIRRGDFVRLGWTLSADYYREALRILLQESATRRIVLFSDNPTQAWQLLESIRETKKFEVLSSPSFLQPLEQIYLMSLAEHVIIANSTFSWWGAATNPDANSIIAPSRWGQEGKLPENLLPKHWILVD